jgi:ribosome-binding protein aMBF1 (putative translation factor)
MTIETFEKHVPCIYGTRIVKIEYDNINKTALQYHSYNGSRLQAMLPGKSNIELCEKNLSIFRYVMKNFTSIDTGGSSSNDFIDFMEYLSTFQDKSEQDDHELVDLQTEVIDNLTLENESKNIQIEELIQKLKEKDDSIKELEDELNEFGEDKSKYLERELVYLQTEVIDNLTLENESKNIQIEELIQKLKEKDNSLKELEYDLINLTI